MNEREGRRRGGRGGRRRLKERRTRIREVIAQIYMF